MLGRVSLLRGGSRALSSSGRRKVTLIRGDGIGQEVTSSVVETFKAMNAPVDWEEVEYKEVEAYELPSGKLSHVCPSLRESVLNNRFVLKGPLITPPDDDSISPDVVLAREFGLFAHVVPVRTLEGVRSRHDKVNMVIIRENTEGEYSGKEHEVAPGVVQSLKVITQQASRRVAEYAFEYAEMNGRKTVAAVHKANIMKMADGLFLDWCRRVAALKVDTGIKFEEVIIDNCCMQIVSKPEQFDVIVTGNLYGNLLSEAAAGLVGSVGVVPGYNVGPSVRIYEQGPRHAGADIAGRNIVNPAGYLLSSSIMLKHMGLRDQGRKLKAAVHAVLKEADQSILTRDLGGTGLTTDFTAAVIAKATQ